MRKYGMWVLRKRGEGNEVPYMERILFVEII